MNVEQLLTPAASWCSQKCCSEPLIPATQTTQDTSHDGTEGENGPSWRHLFIFSWRTLHAPTVRCYYASGQDKHFQVQKPRLVASIPVLSTTSNKADLHLVVYQVQHRILVSGNLKVAEPACSRLFFFYGFPFVALFLLDLTWGKGW